MTGAPAQAKASAEAMFTRAVVSGGAVAEFGQAVSTFNSQVRGWNADIMAAKDRKKAQEVYEGHRPAFNRAEGILTDAAQDARHALRNWDDEKTMRGLWAAGALPTTTRAMFPGLGLKYVNLTAVPPDLRMVQGMTEAERQQFLNENPRLLEDLLAIDDADVAMVETILALVLTRVSGEGRRRDAEESFPADVA